MFLRVHFTRVEKKERKESRLPCFLAFALFFCVKEKKKKYPCFGPSTWCEIKDKVLGKFCVSAAAVALSQELLLLLVRWPKNNPVHTEQK